MEPKYIRAIAALLRKIGYRQVSAGVIPLEPVQFRRDIAECYNYEYVGEPSGERVAAWFRILCRMVHATKLRQFTLIAEGCRVLRPFPCGAVAANTDLNQEINALLIDVFGEIVSSEALDQSDLYAQASAGFEIIRNSFWRGSVDVFLACMRKLTSTKNLDYEYAFKLQIASIMCENLTITRAFVRSNSQQTNTAISTFFARKIIQGHKICDPEGLRLTWIERRIIELNNAIPWNIYPFTD
jgi:hypothetical protein